jgi:predicted ribosomally synthesized peptide with nif11-like leader
MRCSNRKTELSAFPNKHLGTRTTAKGEKGMSVEHLKAYGKLIAENEEIKNKAKEIGFDVEGQIAYGKELGFDFSMEDMQALAEEAGVSEDELSEEQLEQIAGGILSAVLGLTLASTLVGLVLGAGLVGVVGGAAGVGLAGGLNASKW